MPDEDRSDLLTPAGRVHERQLERALHLARGLLVEAAQRTRDAIQLIDNALGRRRD